MTDHPNAGPKVRISFCDDVRQEVGGKHTLVGVYGPVMGLAESPRVLPKLVLMVELMFTVGTPLEELVVSLADGPTTLVTTRLKPPEAIGQLPPGGDYHLCVPVEMMGFEARGGMNLTATVSMGGVVLGTQPLRISPTTA